MPVFVLFVFGAVILGAGAMLSPAWPTPQPRIGLSAALALALIVGGTVFYASLVSWDTLVIDYLLFALVVGIFLGGTLSVGQARAEKHGQILADKDQGWPGPQDLGFFLVVALVFAFPVLILPVPPGTAGQESAYLALVTREGKTFNTLAPFYPDVVHLYAPGFSALTAYLSQQLNQDIPTVQFAAGAVLSWLAVWLAYDFGGELRDKRLGRAMALAMLLSLGVYGMLLSGQFMALLGLDFALAFFIFVVRFLRYRYRVDVVAAGLMLGATVIAYPNMTILALIGFVPWLAAMWLAEPKPDFRTWLILVVAVPVVLLLSISPWLADIADLLRSDIQSPFERSVDHLTVLLTYHGVWIVPVALLGLWLGWQRRDSIVILAGVWLFFIVDFSTTGGIARLFPFQTRFAIPQEIAWHGAIIPYTILGGVGLLWLWDNVVSPRTGALSYRQTYGVNGALVVVFLILLAFAPQVRDLTRETIPDVYASEDDLGAMLWLKDNTPLETRILNAPTASGAWVGSVAERDTVYRPALAFASEPTPASDEDFLAFWEDPADESHTDLLAEAGIDFVIVPQTLPDFEMQSAIGDAPYLKLVYESDGAQVYRFLPE